jgi:hypothetical protein
VKTCHKHGMSGRSHVVGISKKRTRMCVCVRAGAAMIGDGGRCKPSGCPGPRQQRQQGDKPQRLWGGDEGHVCVCGSHLSLVGLQEFSQGLRRLGVRLKSCHPLHVVVVVRLRGLMERGREHTQTKGCVCVHVGEGGGGSERRCEWRQERALHFRGGIVMHAGPSSPAALQSETPPYL